MQSHLHAIPEATPDQEPALLFAFPPELTAYGDAVVIDLTPLVARILLLRRQGARLRAEDVMKLSEVY